MHMHANHGHRSTYKQSSPVTLGTFLFVSSADFVFKRLHLTTQKINP
jgi:hypothetical protein